MADGHGGYRKPTNPAPVSGPGALSRRTDGKQPVMNLPNAAYGEGQEFRTLQQGAPMAQQGPLSVPPQQQSLADLTSAVTPLSAPSTQPNTPVTDGASAGPGQGLSALNLPQPYDQDAAYFKKYLPVLLARAQRDDVPQTFKNFVRGLISSL